MLRRQRVLSAIVMAAAAVVVGGSLLVRQMASDTRDEFVRKGATVAEADSLLGRIDDVARVVSILGVAGAAVLVLAATSLLVARRSSQKWQ